MKAKKYFEAQGRRDRSRGLPMNPPNLLCANDGKPGWPRDYYKFGWIYQQNGWIYQQKRSKY